MNLKPVMVGNKTVGQGNPCYIIAEIGINHNGSIELAKKLIDESGLQVQSAILLSEAAELVKQAVA
jgi:N-acetylneuraminate synthase